MKNKKIILLLIITILLTGCSEKNEKKEQIQLVEVSSGGSTIYQNDNIKIKIADNVVEKESIYTSILNELQRLDEFFPIGNLEIEISKQYIVPNIDKIIKCDTKFIETEEFKKELIKKSYGIYDNWISEGLYAEIYDIEENEIDFATYYANNEFSLFGVRFFEPLSSREEIESIKSASIDLVEYLLENNKKEELLKNEIYIEDIEKWAEDKNIDLTYQREIESLMNRMEGYAVGEKFVINTKEEINGFIINISLLELMEKDEMTNKYDTAEKIEEMILGFDGDIIAIKEGIEKDAPEFYEEYKNILENAPKVEYVIEKDYDGWADGGYIKGRTNTIHLRNIWAQAHEYVHYLLDFPFIENGININKPLWIDEGLANYLDTQYSMTYIKKIEEDFDYIINFETYEKDEEENIVNLKKEIIEKKARLLEENGIDIYNVEKSLNDRNKRIIENNIRFLTSIKFNEMCGMDINKGSATIESIKEGDSVNYHVNFSLFNYLAEEYGLEKVLYLNVADCRNLTYKEYFGKTFEELKEDWINYLKENIKGIETIL